MNTIDISDSRNLDTIKNAINWRDAVNSLLTFWISEGRCFSSGEVAACLRTHMPDLKFSVPKVGEFVRELFYSSIGPYPGGEAVVQVPRFTVGKFPDRTPAQTEVFVYGPTADACNAHDFEV